MLISLLGLMGIPMVVSAQGSFSSPKTSPLEEIVYCHAQEQEWQEADEVYELALKQFKDEKNWEAWVQHILTYSFLNLKGGSIRLAKMDQELDQVESILNAYLPDSFALKAKYCLHKGLIPFNLGAYAEAQKWYEKARKIIEKHCPQNWELWTTYHGYTGAAKDLLGRFDEALYHHKISMALSKKYTSPGDQVRGIKHHNLAVAYSNIDQLDSAFYHLRLSNKIAEANSSENPSQMVSEYGYMGLLFYFQASYDSSLFYLNKGFSYLPSDSTKYGSSSLLLTNLSSIIYLVTGEYELSIKYSKLMIEVMGRYLEPNHINFAPCYSNIGGAYASMGRYAEAKPYYLKALEIYEASNLDEASENLGNIYGNLAELPSNSDSMEMVYLQKAVVGFTHRPINKILILGRLGQSYLRLGQNKQAREALDLRKEILAQLSQERIDLKAILYADLGIWYEKNGLLDSAELSYQKAINYALQVPMEWNPKQAFPARYLARMYQDQGEFDKALVAIQQSLQLLSTRDSLLGNHEREIFPLEKSRSRLIMAEILWSKFQIDRDYSTLNRALDEIKYGIQLHRQWVTWVDQPETVLETGELVRSLSQLGVQISHALYKQEGEEKWLEEALSYTLQAKGFLLNRSLQMARQQGKLGIPDSLAEKERSLVATLSQYEQELLNSRSGGSVDSAYELELVQTAVKAQEEFQALQINLQAAYPTYRASFEDTEGLPFGKIQKRLDGKNHALISYLLTDSVLYQWRITQERVELQTIDWNAELTHALKTTLTGLRDSSISKNAFWDSGYLIYHNLFEKNPLPENISRLTIVPDGELNYLSFEALPSSQENKSFKQATYLLHQYSISYSQAIELWLDAPEVKSAKLSYAGFAPSSTETIPEQVFSELPREGIRWDKLQKLPFTGLEVKQAQSLWQGDVFLASEANEAQFKQSASNYRILHLASHALAHPTYPLQSCILFQKGDSTGQEDGALHGYELIGLKLQAEMAVLTSCHSGYGEVVKGEGPLSLSWAFTYAGCPSLIASLWQANDMVTQRITKAFYQYLTQGKTKDEALRQAKIDYLSSPEVDPLQANPKYWAALVAIGQMDPLEKPGTTMDILPWAFWGIILIVLAWYFISRSRSKLG